MQQKNIVRLGYLSLFAAWAFDQLFWQKAPGISFFIFILLCLAVGFYLTWIERLKPPVTSLLLLLPVTVFAALTFLRVEPLSRMISYTYTLGSMLLLAMSWLGGSWWRYNLSDHIRNLLLLAGNILVKPFAILLPAFSQAEPVWGHAGAEVPTTPETAHSPGKGRASKVLPVFYGVLLALPVVTVLALLLSAADPIFSRFMRDVLEFIRLERIGEYIFRVIYISIVALLISGIYLYSLLKSRNEKVTGSGESWLSPFLGWTEAIIVLASVNLLFLSFVIIQFQYFFGGGENIRIDGFTYAEYARRGFNELVTVAVISLLIFLTLSMITRRDLGKPSRIFSVLGITLVALVAVMLMSAYQRLLLYEAAYGFSRIRTYSHVFMIWLGLLLAATVFLEGTRRLRFFALAAILCGLGFGLTLNLINVDGFITNQNVRRAVQEFELDASYLTQLSDDAVPVMFELYNSGWLPQDVRDQLGSVLACRAAMAVRSPVHEAWPSYQVPRSRAIFLYRENQAILESYQLSEVDGRRMALINGIEIRCDLTHWLD